MFNMRFFLAIFMCVLLIAGGIFLMHKQNTREVIQETVKTNTNPQQTSKQRSSTRLSFPESYYIEPGNFVGQTFNNCGPASLSMTLSLFGKNVSQADLASSMRPFNNPQGGVDDKSIFAHEFVSEAERQGLNGLSRPNGTMDLLKTLISNDIPVVVRTWLNDSEDIGHFRVVTGYDSHTQTITYQDSYYGPNQTQTESAFTTLWQPFNYGYILVYPDDKKQIVTEILGENMDEKTAWENAKKRAEQENSLYCHSDSGFAGEGYIESSATLQNDSECAFAKFNLAIAEYNLKNYDKTIDHYEDAISGLPGRMLWYQPEPIYAYQKTKQYEKALMLADSILQNGNLAYSELYQIKGEIYLIQGNKDAAYDMFEKAVYYNSSFQPAKEALHAI